MHVLLQPTSSGHYIIHKTSRPGAWSSKPGFGDFCGLVVFHGRTDDSRLLRFQLMAVLLKLHGLYVVYRAPTTGLLSLTSRLHLFHSYVFRLIIWNYTMI